MNKKINSNNEHMQDNIENVRKECVDVDENGNFIIEREYKRGDIVAVRDEWLEPDEDPNMKYVVLEPRGDRMLVQALGTGLPFAATYVYDVAWVRYAGSVHQT